MSEGAACPPRLALIVIPPATAGVQLATEEGKLLETRLPTISATSAMNYLVLRAVAAGSARHAVALEKWRLAVKVDSVLCRDDAPILSI